MCKMKMTFVGNGWLAVTALWLVMNIVSGCVAVQSFPTSARAGDTVMLAVGSPEGMEASNTSATYTPSGGGAVPLPIRSIFKLYPDKTSAAWLNSNAVAVENQTGHGPWTTIIALDLPGSLVESSGVVRITTSAVYPPPPARDINDAEIALEILPASAGAGLPNPFTYELAAGAPVPGDLSQLEPQRRLVVKPMFTGSGGVTYGAIEVRVTIPSLGALPGDDIRVIADEKIKLYAADRRIQYIWSVQGDDLVVSFISPAGGLEYYQADFSVISADIMALVDVGIVDVSTLVPVVTYYDLDGADVTGGDLFAVIDET